MTIKDLINNGILFIHSSSSILIMIIWITSCSKHPTDVSITPRTSLEYAMELESIFGLLPRFSCSDAIEIPFEKNGISIPNKGSWNAEDCDLPTAFGKPCDPGYKVGRYAGLNYDGTENSDVVWITNCRDGGMGVIGYKFSTGETCFLHVTIGIDVESKNIPIPSEVGYSKSWQKPEVVASDKCMNCHQSSPFLHSLAVDQLKMPDNPLELLVPITGNEPYSIVGAEFQQPTTANFDKNKCVTCHRPQCTEHFQNYPLDELVMPPPFQNATNFDHSETVNTDRQAIRDWCATLGLEN